MKDLGMLRRACWSGWLGWSGWWLGAVVLGMVLPVYGQYGPGTGEPNNPYQIWDPNQMNAIGANPGDWGKCFKLMTDIDMSQFTGTQYRIIGNSTTKFTGTFDGNEHVISNLTYTTTAAIDLVGLFGCTDHATIKNLGVENILITSGGYFVGGLVGENSSGTITGCFSTGSISVTNDIGYYLGGLVGSNDSGTITDCYTTTTVSGTSFSIGGLVGYNYNLSTIADCYATGSVNGCREVGGLVGLNGDSLILQRYKSSRNLGR